MRRRAAFQAVLVPLALGLAVLAPCAPAAAQSVLVFDENSTHGRARDACMRLGLTCTRAMAADFETRITSGTWDLIVVDLPSSEPSGAWQAALSAYITAGGRAIHTQWNSGSLGGLGAAYQVTIGASHDGIPFHRWSSSPLFAAPQAVPSSFTVITDVWGTNGFYLEPISPAYASAGFTTTPATNQAAIVIGNAERTIFNGILFDDFTGDADTDGIPDIVELIMNEISFLLGGSAPTAPCVGLAEGAMCTVASGAPGRCRMGGCCTGCWDGTRCQIGSSATACGAAGAACASCADAMPCTSDVCTAGACSNPTAPAGTACDDGLFCTLTDACTAAGACVGGGVRCDDGQICTTDTCDESTDMCSFVTGMGCTIGGGCVADGAINPTYPCQVCDPTRDAMDWSPRAVGTECGMERCAAGRLHPPPTCDAAGLCAPGVSVRCATGMCADATSCEPTCADTGCPAGEWCAPDGACMPQMPGGTTCISDAACASGECTDGVCCDVACDGTCERCDLAGSDGTCAPIAAGTDPDMECALACDGAGACEPDADAGVPPMDGGPGGDAGTTPMLDGGSAGTDAGGMRPATRGGCSCDLVTRASTPWSALAMLLALGAAAALRRRRRARRARA